MPTALSKFRSAHAISPSSQVWVESSRLHALTSERRERFLPFAPDFLIEILSHSDSLPELDVKMRQWIANGTKLAWRIAPFGGTVSIFSTENDPLMLRRPEIPAVAQYRVPRNFKMP